MRKKKRRDTEIFSLSFLDCICCGFGAVLLLFVLTASRKDRELDDLQSQIMEVIGQMENDIDLKEQEMVDLRLTLALETKRREDSGARLDETKRRRTELEDNFKLLLARLAAIEEELGKLIADKKNLPTQEEEKAPIPIPNPDRRQYLTGFDILGDQVLFLVESSGGMTADTIVEAGDFVDKTSRERRDAPKWRRVKTALKWLIANLREGSNYKIVFYGEDVLPLELDLGRTWFDPMDGDLTVDVLDALEDVDPVGGANLEKAFRYVSEMPVEPDRLVLICDGLPTSSDSYPAGRQVTYDDRVSMFKQARAALNFRIPVNTIMYPSMPDTGSAVHYWRLANTSGGTLITPSESWPDI